MDLMEALDEPIFWILGIGGVGMEVLGYIGGKSMGFGSMPIWQLVVMMIGTVLAAAYFATND